MQIKMPAAKVALVARNTASPYSWIARGLGGTRRAPAFGEAATRCRDLQAINIATTAPLGSIESKPPYSPEMPMGHTADHVIAGGEPIQQYDHHP